MKHNVVESAESSSSNSSNKAVTISATRIYIMRSAIITGNLDACINYKELIEERIDKTDKRLIFHDEEIHI